MRQAAWRRAVARRAIALRRSDLRASRWREARPCESCRASTPEDCVEVRDTSLTRRRGRASRRSRSLERYLTELQERECSRHGRVAQRNASRSTQSWLRRDCTCWPGHRALHRCRHRHPGESREGPGGVPDDRDVEQASCARFAKTGSPQIDMFEKMLVAGWRDMDYNSHMANTAYLDRAADVRMMYFAENGFTVDRHAAHEDRPGDHEGRDRVLPRGQTPAGDSREPRHRRPRARRQPLHAPQRIHAHRRRTLRRHHQHRRLAGPQRAQAHRAAGAAARGDGGAAEGRRIPRAQIERVKR